MARAVDVRVVARLALVLHVRDRDRHGLRLVTNGAALRDVLVADDLREALLRLHLHESCGRRRLAVVDVTDGSDVDVRLRAVEFLLSHDLLQQTVQTIFKNQDPLTFATT